MKKSPQILDYSKHILLVLSVNVFLSDHDRMAANNLRNIHVSVDVLSTLRPLQQDNSYDLQQQNVCIKFLNLN